jgi:hypothetical protein
MNPFKVYSPEDMSAEQVNSLFVPVVEKLEIDGPEHVFVNGHRGCGKSMLLRTMAPDCQMLERGAELKALPYLGVYATIKTTGLDVAEYERLKSQYVGLILAEHSLVSFLSSKVFESLNDHCLDAIERANGLEELKIFAVKNVLNRLLSAGVQLERELAAVDSADSVTQLLKTLSGTLDSVYGLGCDYLRRSAFVSDYQPYRGPLLAYRDFLFPILCDLMSLTFMPQGKPLYYLLDDADNLNTMQTQVLNTWISFRTGHRVSFKVSTQLAYKTSLTSTRERIEAPHDFRELHVSNIHTGASSSASYPQWVDKVVQKRLKQQAVDVPADKFFPEDEEQEEKIREIARELKTRWEMDGGRGGYRANDDAYRYARPDYIKSLGGRTKQQSRYRYAGFQQLVHISSGIIRFFLDNAAQMFAQQQLVNQRAAGGEVDLPVAAIEPSVQDEIVREAADSFMLGDLDRLEQEANSLGSLSEANEFRQLRNLIRTLGGIFYEILVSDRSERRVFSVALSDDPPEDIMRIFKLGVRNGYFYEAAIGSKEGRWRTRRYVMTRRLAPHFKLDPMGFSGYLFVTSELLAEALVNPRHAISEFQAKRLGRVVEQDQLPLEF